MRRLWNDLGWYPRLWTTLAIVSVVVVASPTIPVAGPNPPLAVISATLAAGMGLTILYLGILRFSVFGRPLDLLAGFGFGVLGFANLVLLISAPVRGLMPEQAVLWLYLRLLTRTAAATLVIAAVVQVPRTVRPEARRAFGVRAGAVSATAVLLAAVAILAVSSMLPPPAGPAAWDILSSRATIGEMLPGQAAWLLVVDGAIAALLLAGAGGFALQANRIGDHHLHSLALTFSLLAFAQVHALSFPPLDPDYVSVGDGFRLAGYLVLLCSVVARMGHEIVEHVAREERLRISRELHDGLAQHLSLLHLRLTLATSPSRDVDRRADDLTSARRLVEAALLEARQAVIALRMDTVSWEQFCHGLRAFTDEFSKNHEVEVGMAIDGATGTVDAGLQAEVLRILHEAFSNAVRHGDATLIAARVEASRSTLEISVADNGAGFQPDRADGKGVGLLSMRERIGRRGGTLDVRSAPGLGVRISARLPLAAAGKAP